MKRLRSLQRREERQPAALFTSVVLHVAIFAVVFIMARKVAQSTTSENRVLTFRAPPPPPPPPPKGGKKKPREEKKVEIKKPDTPVEVIVPVEIPRDLPEDEPPIEEEDEGVDEGVEGGVEGGVVGGVIGGVVGGVLGGVLGGELPEEPWDPNMAREITVGVTPPKLVKKAPPEYPLAAQRRKIEGEVVLRCIITSKGDVKVESVLQGDEALAGAASRAVERWKYEAAVYKDRPQSVYLIVRMTFKLPKK